MGNTSNDVRQMKDLQTSTLDRAAPTKRKKKKKNHVCANKNVERVFEHGT